MSEADNTAPRQRVRNTKTMILKTESVTKAYPVLAAQESRQHMDEFAGFYGSAVKGSEHTVIEPSYPPQALIRHANASGVLRTCIDAMATNVDGFGYTLEYIGPEESRESQEAQEEFNRVRGLLDHPNGEYSLIDLRKRFRVDKETVGYGTIEVIRNPTDGFPDMLLHMPSFTVRATTQDRDPMETRRYMPRPGAAKDNMIPVRTRFRRFVQIIGGVPVFFRESGDMRPVDYRTGKAGDGVAPELQASDVVMDHIYSPGSRYGAPRWIGDLRSVLGIQEAENLNLSFFKDNGMPAMVMFILGGAMTPEAITRFEDGVRLSKGSGMANKISLIEVAGDPASASEDGAIPRPDVKIQPLTHDRQTDAFFQEYENNAAKKLRSSFRIPALFTGLSEDVRYAVAEASMAVAENQVFGPERAQTDDLFNYQILTYNGMPMRYWRFRSNPPRITSGDEVMRAIKTFDAVGAMTPNVAIALANEMFDLQIPVVEEDWGNMPFAMTIRPQRTAEPPGAPGADGEQVQQAAKAVKPAPRQRVRRMMSVHRDALRPEGTTIKAGVPRPAPRVLTPHGGDGYAVKMADARGE